MTAVECMHVCRPCLMRDGADDYSSLTKSTPCSAALRLFCTASIAHLQAIFVGHGAGEDERGELAKAEARRRAAALHGARRVDAQLLHRCQARHKQSRLRRMRASVNGEVNFLRSTL